MCVAFFTFAFAFSSCGADNSKSILFIEQEETSRPAISALVSGLRQNLSTNLPGRVVLYTESLDMSRFDGSRYQEGLERWLRTKYRGRSLDVIVVGGERSLELTLELRADLWPRVPIVFTSIPRERAARFAGYDNLTGVTMEVDVRRTLETAIQLCPDTKRIAFVGSEQGHSEIFRQAQADAERFATNRFDFIPLTGLTLGETKQRVATLPPHTVVLYLSVWVDASGQIFDPRDALAELANVSSAPVFGIAGTHLGYGIVGGSCIDPTALGNEVGSQVAAVARTGNAREVPVRNSAATELIFDWNELRRHQLHKRQLPAGAHVRFRPPSLWESHRDAVVIVAAALTLQSGLIAGLLFQRFHRRRAEHRLRETEDRMSLAIQASGLGMWVWHAESNGTEFTPRCRRLCGFGTDHAMGRADGCTGVDAEVCPMLAEAVRQLKPSTPTFETECLHGKEEGNPCWISSRGRGYFDKEGKLERLIGVSMDVTERRSAARTLQEQREQLAHVGRVSLMGQLASSLAHELNQPLGAILRNAEAAEMFLQKAPLDLAELRAILADIRKDDERAGAVIDRVRALLKRRNLEPSELALPALLEDVLSLARPDAGAHHVQLQAETETGLPVVQGDRVQIQQVLLNLLLNAVDAITDAGSGTRRVVVRAAKRVDGVEISVADTGPGVAPACLPRLFEPFFSTKKDGMGMGLAISRDIIEVHGGRIWAENNTGGGATFRFTLPVPPTADGAVENFSGGRSEKTPGPNGAEAVTHSRT